MSGPWLGVIADDLTGACDVAGGLTSLGLATSLLIGTPEGRLDKPADCVVIALRARTSPVERAVAESIATARWLRSLGVGRLYQKYCSTFDSTSRGNIGPVADELADLLGSGVSVGTPATPAAGRTQDGGILFVHGVPLAESSMRHHPLTPMTESDLIALFGRQSRRPVDLLPRATRFVRPASSRHVLADAVDDADLDALAADIDLVGTDILAGGGAGFALALARRHQCSETPQAATTVGEGRRLILCGSGSSRTREQLANFAGPVLSFDPIDVVDNPSAGVTQLVGRLMSIYEHSNDGPALVTSTNEPGAVSAAQTLLGPGAAAALVEGMLGRVAVEAIERLGVRRIVVAGGETSGAVADALQLFRLEVRTVLAPGVPWTVGVRPDGTAIALLFKSGNFGEPDLFQKAWESSP
ncbi:MAG TPA: 3-oxo-tetronate kinase [Galbitalea sp.]|jgi:uncharacterized protein YgbK (DUF1537 family)|nr:3-oxo-tetronate kinase [Galbitalea sp.]